MEINNKPYFILIYGRNQESVYIDIDLALTNSGLFKEIFNTENVYIDEINQTNTMTFNLRCSNKISLGNFLTRTFSIFPIYNNENYVAEDYMCSVLVSDTLNSQKMLDITILDLILKHPVSFIDYVRELLWDGYGLNISRDISRIQQQYNLSLIPDQNQQRAPLFNFERQ